MIYFIIISNNVVFSNIQWEVSHFDNPMVIEDKYHPALSLVCTFSVDKPINFPRHGNDNHNISAFNFRKADFISLYNDILLTDWSLLSTLSSVDLMVDCFYNILFNLFRKHVPVFRSKAKPWHYPPWFNKEIINNIKFKFQYLKKYRASGLHSYLLKFKEIRSLLKKQINTAYKLYINNIQINIHHDPKQFWGYINAKKGKTRIPGQMSFGINKFENPMERVNAFSDFFRSTYTESDPLDEYYLADNENST